MNKVIGREKAKEILNLKYPSIYKLLSYAVSNYRGYILYNLERTIHYFYAHIKLQEMFIYLDYIFRNISNKIK